LDADPESGADCNKGWVCWVKSQGWEYGVKGQRTDWGPTDESVGRRTGVVGMEH